MGSAYLAPDGKKLVFVAVNDTAADKTITDVYKRQVYYYKLARDDEGYSQAFRGYREELIQRYFGWFVAAFFLLAAAFVYTEIRYARRKGGER